jgi:hypothetical protein
VLWEKTKATIAVIPLRILKKLKIEQVIVPTLSKNDDKLDIFFGNRSG